MSSLEEFLRICFFSKFLSGDETGKKQKQSGSLVGGLLGLLLVFVVLFLIVGIILRLVLYLLGYVAIIVVLAFLESFVIFLYRNKRKIGTALFIFFTCSLVLLGVLLCALNEKVYRGAADPVVQICTETTGFNS